MTQATRHIDELDRLFPAFGDTSRFTISCHRADYSASRIARAVEDVNAHLLNLNVTEARTAAGVFDLDDPMAGPAGESTVFVDLRVNCADPSSVIRSLERYGFVLEDVADSSHDNLDAMRDHVKEILHILEM